MRASGWRILFARGFRREGQASEDNGERDQIVYACEYHKQHRPNPARQNPRADFPSPDFFVPVPRRSRRADGRRDCAVKHHLRGDKRQTQKRRRRPRKSEDNGKPNSRQQNQEKDSSFGQRGPRNRTIF